MAVPKTAMHKDDFALGSKNEIGAAGEVSRMKSVTISHAMDESSDK